MQRCEDKKIRFLRLFDLFETIGPMLIDQTIEQKKSHCILFKSYFDNHKSKSYFDNLKLKLILCLLFILIFF